MNTKMLIATILGGIAFFILGALIWGMALSGFLEKYSNAACMRSEEEFNMILMGVSNLIMALAYSYIFTKANVSSFSGGATCGAIIAILIGLSMDLGMYSMTTLTTNITPAFINIVANGIWGAIGGGVIGWWLGRK